MIRSAPAVLLMTAMTLLCSCSHYHLGNPGVDCAPFHKIYVKPVVNDSYAPQAQTLVTEQIHHWLHLAGMETTQCEDEADAVLAVTLTHYNRTTATTLEQDTAVAGSFAVTLHADCSLYNPCNECVYFSGKPVFSSINAQAEKSVQTVLYHDMPVLTRKLAKEITNLVTSGW